MKLQEMGVLRRSGTGKFTLTLTLSLRERENKRGEIVQPAASVDFVNERLRLQRSG